MLRYMISTALLLVLVLAATQSVLAEIDVVRVTPNNIPDEIRVIHEHGDKIGKFKVRLRLARPQLVTRHLTIQWQGEEVVLFSMADVITEREIEVRFSLPMESIASTTFHLATGPFKLKDGVAKPDLGGTNYVIRPADFLLKFTAPEPDFRTMPRSRDDFGSSLKGDRVSIEQADNAVLATVAAKKLVEKYSSETSIDTSRTIKFLGKNGGVEIHPGSSLLIELPQPTHEFAWHAGDAPEVVGNSALPFTFTQVWCRWQSDGTLTWKCYGPSEKK